MKVIGSVRYAHKKHNAKMVGETDGNISKLHILFDLKDDEK
jgi:hypothetical protein